MKYSVLGESTDPSRYTQPSQTRYHIPESLGKTRLPCRTKAKRLQNEARGASFKLKELKIGAKQLIFSDSANQKWTLCLRQILIRPNE